MKNNLFKIFSITFLSIIISNYSTQKNYIPHYLDDDIVFIPHSRYENKLNRFPASGILNSCFEIIQNILKHPPKHSELPTPHGLFRYPHGIAHLQGKHIQYGFESEYVANEAQILLKQYMPEMFGNQLGDTLDIRTNNWLKLSHNERLQFIHENHNTIFPYREKGKMIKISDDPEVYNALPDSIVFDSGNFEIVMPPHDTAEEIAGKIRIINKNIGVGSMQLMISRPLERDLLLNTLEKQTQETKNLLGYYNFMNDFDTLGKLHAGHIRYLENPDQEVVKSFNHPWLGPMTELKHKKLKTHIENIVKGKKYSDLELEEMSYIVTSHKFLGGLSYRPDVAYKHNRIASEVRDCHKNVDCITNRLIRETYFLIKGLDQFGQFSNLKSFDTIKGFEMFSNFEQHQLKNIFPSYSNYIQTELELFRNFSYPFRDWSKHIEVLNVPHLAQQITEAQNVYKSTIGKILKDLNDENIEKQVAKQKIMGALAEFSDRSGIMEALSNMYQKLFNSSEVDPSLLALKLE